MPRGQVSTVVFTVTTDPLSNTPNFASVFARIQPILQSEIWKYLRPGFGITLAAHSKCSTGLDWVAVGTARASQTSAPFDPRNRDQLAASADKIVVANTYINNHPTDRVRPDKSGSRAETAAKIQSTAKQQGTHKPRYQSEQPMWIYQWWKSRDFQSVQKTELWRVSLWRLSHLPLTQVIHLNHFQTSENRGQ